MYKNIISFFLPKSFHITLDLHKWEFQVSFYCCHSVSEGLTAFNSSQVCFYAYSKQAGLSCMLSYPLIHLLSPIICEDTK